MDLSEELKYRLAYLTMRLVFDQKLATASDAGKYPAILQYLDIIAGTAMASEAAGKKYKPGFFYVRLNRIGKGAKRHWAVNEVTQRVGIPIPANPNN